MYPAPDGCECWRREYAKPIYGGHESTAVVPFRPRAVLRPRVVLHRPRVVLLLYEATEDRNVRLKEGDDKRYEEPTLIRPFRRTSEI